MRKIIDQFTDLPISGARKTQLRRERRGLCIDCPNQAGQHRRCEQCLLKAAVQKRNHYRQRHGIPLGTPLYTREKK